MSPALASRFFTTEPLGSPVNCFLMYVAIKNIHSVKKKNCRAAIAMTHFQIAFMVPGETLYSFNTLILPLQPLVTSI